MSRTYVVLTLLLAVLIVGYLALTSDSTSIRPQEIMASESELADTPSPGTDQDKEGHNLWMIISTAVLVVMAVIATVVLARLQHRRREAYRKVAQQQKDQARAAARSSSNLDDR
ncbi:MAG: hypothetical protein JXL80_01890 [Planctomycetes bacterium]|nr:hypothetical protein [Planctomycetota bacterium]